jgi:threonine dehydratase
MTLAPAPFPVSFADIQAAAEAIEGVVEKTPALYSHTLSLVAGCDIFLKFENLHFTASFKERGALNKLKSLTPEECRHGVIAMSQGNHAQAVAYHAGRLKIPATIVMPVGAPFTKVKHTRDFGARVVLHGSSLTDAGVRAQEIAKAENLAFVHPYDDPLVIAGQGTAALEFLAQCPDIDTLVVPIGGGGLISGMSIAARAMKPGITIYGVETALYPSMKNALKGEAAAVGGQTIAEGIAVKAPGVIAQKVIAANVADILLEGEAEIEAAIVKLLEIEKTLAEGAGAAALAAVLARPHLFKGRKIGVVISGGNIDIRLLSNVILREMAREGRILSLTVEIEDRPGVLAHVAAIVGDAGGNILEVSHNRLMTGLSAKSADLGLFIEARDDAHATEIKDLLRKGGFTIHETHADNHAAPAR